jgi:hypothetical protein
MEALALSEDALAVLRAISQAGFSYQRTKELCLAAKWKLVDDKLDLGYVAFRMGMAPGQDFPARLAVEVAESGCAPRASVPLFYFEDYDTERVPFDLAFRSLSEQLACVLGQPSSVGEYTYPHRAGWLYSYCWWSLPDATLALLQDEFDIQFGMDITLWVFPAHATVAVPVSCT